MNPPPLGAVGNGAAAPSSPLRIAFTPNLKQNASEAEAEFDTPETVEAIRGALAELGHTVDLVEVSGPPAMTIAKLEALNPDLVFNTAEGRLGRYREAFYPGIFENLGLPFTGSDAYVCTVTLDKNLTKTLLAPHGIRMARGAFVQKAEEALKLDLRFPVILKPNFEGSSKGITQDSVVENPDTLRQRLRSLLKSYPAGILIEEYIVGKDVTVPYLEALPTNGGVMTPLEYVFSENVKSSRKYVIYDYALKNQDSDHVDVRPLTGYGPDTVQALQEATKKVIQVLGCRDLGRVDFRVTPEGEIFFIEINALPSLEPGAGIYVAAGLAGFATPQSVLGTVIQSALARNGLLDRNRKPMKKSRKGLRVGFSYNEKRITPGHDPSTDTEAEYDSPKTLDSIRNAIRAMGHEVVDLEATAELASVLPTADVDVVFNIAEGIKGRNRESQVPALLELLDIPYTGSDPATLALTLDKGLAKRIVRDMGVRTPAFFSMSSGKAKIPQNLRYPLIGKPVAEGSSKGVMPASVVKNEAELRALAEEITKKYRQSALIEEFLPGREFTVALLGESRPKALPPMEIVFTNPKDEFPVYSYGHKLESNQEVRYEVPAKVDPQLLRKIEHAARAAFLALGCRDVARVDLRLDADGEVNFIECNPLPGLTPGWSDLCLISDSAGIPYQTLIHEILSPAIRRFKEKKKLLMQGKQNHVG
ncbi:MAG: ATP-grasp domain-containing protein [Bdellovibrionales bacterium]|nr:ATP-grasp domain-containing protein [Bdellovibrionales bacterium]